MLTRSPSATSSAFNTSLSFSTGTDSPVKADSSTFKLAVLASRISAGTTSPASSKTISPGTISVLGISKIAPPRLTWALGVDISFKASIAASDLAS